jgi:D-alanyl-D-alanine carboxypeptidase
LVYSANDSAYNLASHYIQSITGFVGQMNDLAKKYSLGNTHFTNFDGLHNYDHYSSVYSLSQLGRLAMRNPIIRETVKLKNVTVTDTSGNISHSLVSTDELLNIVPEIEGFKTGWTPEAGECFLGLININGHYLISVVAQSQDRFADTKLIVDWTKANISWEKYE